MRAAALSVVLLLMSGAVAGQGTGAGNSAAASAGNSNQSTMQTVRGCLSQTDHTYVLLGTAPVRQYRIVGGDLEALKGKIGHTVEITGAVGNRESGASPNGMYNPGSTTGVGYATITAEGVKEIYANCG